MIENTVPCKVDVYTYSARSITAQKSIGEQLIVASHQSRGKHTDIT